jgi:competence protein ComEC
MLNAMLFGDRTGLTHVLREGFERTGTFHLFVVSGLHVALLAGRALLAPAPRALCRRQFAVLLTIAPHHGYALLTGFGLPVAARSGMTAVYLLARWLDRDTNALNALGAAARRAGCFAPRAL